MKKTKTKKKSNIYKSAAQVTVFSTFEKALSFVYRIILSRSIGAEGLGIYQICLSVFSVFLTAASSGIPVTVSRLIAKNTAIGNAKGKHAVVTAGILCTLLFTVPAALVMFLARDLYAFLFPDRDCVKIFLWLLPGLILTSIYAIMRGSFWGNKQFLPYSIIELAENAVMVACGCALIGFAHTAKDGARMAVIAVLVSYIFSFAVSLGWYFFKGGRIVNPKPQFKPLVKASLPITAMRTSTSLLNSCVAMFLPALLSKACGYTGSEALALYGTVIGMSVPMLMIPNSLIGSIAVVVAPEMSENFYAKRNELLKRDIERTIKSSVLIATVLIPVMFTLGEDIGILFYASGLSGAVMRRFSFMMLPMCISMITTTILNSLNFEVRTLIYFFIGAIAMIGTIFGFTHLLGINAYMVGLTLSFVITAALNLRLLKKNCPDINYLGYLLKSIAICAAACLFGWLLSNLFAGVLPAIWRLILCGGAVSLFALGAFCGMEMLSARPIKKLFSKA
ncbi:MAG: oligosaccharide flippase family protein [Clostridiales bacterium]|nr:oligosaccharide flippase family protein [Clostridiales bacterium]